MNGGHAEAIPVARSSAIAIAHEDRLRTWRRVTVFSAGCVTVMDLILLQRKHGLFLGGFLADHQLGTVFDVVAFVMLSLLLNAAIVAPVAAVVLALGSRTGLRPHALRFAAVCIAAGPLALADMLTYEVFSYLGGRFDLRLMLDLMGHRTSELLAVTAPLLTRPMALVAYGVLASGVVTLILHRASRTQRDILLPTLLDAVYRCATLVLLASVIVVFVSLTSESAGFGMRWTPSGQFFVTLLNRASDVDRDGYGLLRHPVDHEPLDPHAHPYALDFPGNHIDENGLGGDHPPDFPVYRRSYTAEPWPQRPTVVLFLLESVSASALGARHNGRSITPTMDALAARGLRVESAWSHNGFTAQSRYHLLTGSLREEPTGGSLLHDFANQGYDVAYFSGQDDGFGNLPIDRSRLAVYYDARLDVANRYSLSATPGSLAVPHSVVEQRVREYLSSRTTDKPLFLYVNFHDTHYPYHHDRLANLLGIDPLPASRISPGRRLELTQTYLNAVSNVDRAIGRVLESVEARVGEPPAVIVTSDHGESLFEHGFLGHGYALNEAQTRIPLIVSGIPAVVRVPFGQVDLRHMVNDALSGTRRMDRPPGIRQEAEARVFQYLGSIQRPSQISWRTSSETLTYDFRTGRVTAWEVEQRLERLPDVLHRQFLELVRTWESVQLPQTRTEAPVAH